jgi:hypothetical protein
MSIVCVLRKSPTDVARPASSSLSSNARGRTGLDRPSRDGLLLYD